MCPSVPVPFDQRSPEDRIAMHLENAAACDVEARILRAHREYWQAYKWQSTADASRAEAVRIRQTELTQ